MEDYNKKYGFIPSKESSSIAYCYKIQHKPFYKFNYKYYRAVYARGQNFYLADGGGRTEKDENGVKFSTPTLYNPVFMTNSYYDYDYQNDLNLQDTCWLASKCVNLYSPRAVFSVRLASSSYVGAGIVCGSYGDVHSPSCGVRPIVSLSSMLQVDEIKGDGKTWDTAWQFAKD